MRFILFADSIRSMDAKAPGTFSGTLSILPIPGTEKQIISNTNARQYTEFNIFITLVIYCLYTYY